MGTPSRRFFIYNTRFLAAAFPGANTNQNGIVITRDNDFLATMIMFTEVIAVPAYANYTVRVSDTRSNEQWFFTPIPAVEIQGSGQRPYYMPAARYLPMNTTITVEVASAAIALGDIVVSFHGFKMSEAEAKRVTGGKA